MHPASRAQSLLPPAWVAAATSFPPSALCSCLCAAAGARGTAPGHSTKMTKKQPGKENRIRNSEEKKVERDISFGGTEL